FYSTFHFIRTVGRIEGWKFLFRCLDKAHSHSTVIWKIWLTVLFVFRILLLGAVGEKLILVSTPTLVYLGHVLHVIHKEEKLRQRKLKEEQDESDNLLQKKTSKLPKYTDTKGKVKIRRSLLSAYMAHIIAKILLEVTFIVVQYYLYGFMLYLRFSCARSPCPHRVECFLSRPTEKTIFSLFMLVVAVVSLILNLIEILYVCGKQICNCTRKKSKNCTTSPTVPLTDVDNFRNEDHEL
uniref:Gap junction protein n=1 Tax=Lepisosteus oculatus TaxID=7918 RepID=W5NL32_LEPOC